MGTSAVLVQVFHTLQVAAIGRCCTFALSSHGHPLLQSTRRRRVADRPLLHTPTHPMDTRSRASTSNTPGGDLSRVNEGANPWVPEVQVFQTLQAATFSRCFTHPFKYEKFSCKYFKHSRWPPSAAPSATRISMDTHYRASISNTPGGRD